MTYISTGPVRVPLLDKLTRKKPATPVIDGNTLRDRSWRLIFAAQLDYAPKFIESPDSAAPVNGLMRSKEGYYRLAEDRRNGQRVLLHSYERHQLEGVRRDGVVSLPPLQEKDVDVYVVSARRDVRGAIFRDDMAHDIRFLERGFQRDLNLHVKERPAAENDGLRVVKFMNGRCGIGIFETPDARYRVRFYKNLRTNWRSVSRFTQIERRAPETRWQRLLSLGTDMNTFDSYEEALTYTRRLWNVTALNIFKGRGLIGDTGTIKQSLAARLIDFVDNKRYRDWGVAIPVAFGSGFLSTLVSGTPALGALIAVGAGAGWVFGAKMVENFIGHNWVRLAAKSDEKQLDALRPYFEKNLRDQYLKPGVTNEQRLRQKLEPSILPHLRLLDHEESDMNYDDGTFVPADNPMRDLESLSTAPFRYFGAQFDATHFDDGLLAAVYPNGLVTLTQVDTKTRATRHYLTYRDDFNIMAAGAQKHMDPGLTRLPGAGPVHKITHYRGQEFRYASMSAEECIGDLMVKCGDKVKDLNVVGMSLPALFGVRAGATMVARNIAGVPASQIIRAVQPS